MSIITIFEDTRAPSLQDTVQVSGLPFDLTGSTVRFKMRLSSSGIPLVDQPATIISAVAGTVQYDWGVSDLATPGSYRGWWAVTLPNGKLQDSDEFPIVIAAHAAVGPLQIRDHVETGLDDGALQKLVDEARQEVEARWGTDSTVTVRLRGNYRKTIKLSRPALTITSITEMNEQTTFLAALSLTPNPDYMLSNDGRTLTRLSGGGWGWNEWAPYVDVVYVPKPEQELRDRMVIDLVKLEVNYTGLMTETVGDYNSSMFGIDHTTYVNDRELILMGPSFRRGFRIA